MVIGTIVKSNSHISYLCRVYGKLETDSVPNAEDYAFGTFVTLVPGEPSAMRLIGVVCDTLLLNPDYGNLGPRLSSTDDLAVFSPDYLNERGVLVEILIVGWVDEGKPRQSIPPLAAQVGALVEPMQPEQIYAFHRDQSGRFQAGYIPPLLTRNDPMVPNLLLTILESLEPAFPQHRRVIGVLKNNLAWKARVVPAG